MKVINQQKNSIIEDLLYSKKVKRTFSAVTQEDSKHPYGSWRDIKYLWSNYTWSEYISNYMIKLF